MEQESTTGPGSLLSLCNQHPFESQQQSHNTAFFGMTRVCLFVFQQGTRDRKKNTHWHTTYRPVSWQEAKLRRRVPSSKWNRDELPQSILPSHFYSFSFILLPLFFLTHWTTRANLTGGQSFLDGCWIAFEPMLSKLIFSKPNFRARKSLML